MNASKGVLCLPGHKPGSIQYPPSSTFPLLQKHPLTQVMSVQLLTLMRSRQVACTPHER